ncbi:MAG TPA: hypothetical protein VFD60_12525, partial [Nitrososphaeraceae archaeon]|nr:hypothetical protein [Nitrososphaeraceae archaeon]
MPSEASDENFEGNSNNIDTRKISRKGFLKLLGAGASILMFGRFSDLAALLTRRQANALQTFTPSVPLFPFNPDVITAQRVAGSRIGKWDIYSVLPNATPEQAEKCPVLPIHAALLRTGKVLFLSSSQNDPTFFSCKKFRNVVWDPAKPIGPGAFNVIDTPPGEPHTDIFCCGQSFLPDGRLLISGGTELYNDPNEGLSPLWDGAKQTYLFDPQMEMFQYTPNNDMHLGRWYPSVVTLGNGRILSISGYEVQPETSQPEIYLGTDQGWTLPLSYSAS